jgi:hypothetical protein
VSYDIRQAGKDKFDLYEDGTFLCSFSRETFRESLGHISSSNNWIGSILRLFHEKFPLPLTFTPQTPFERMVANNGVYGIATYLRSKGYRVVKPSEVPDKDLIAFVESHGYVVEGICDNVYYCTGEQLSGRRSKADNLDEVLAPRAQDLG